MKSYSFLYIGGAFLIGATASMLAPDASWIKYSFIALLACLPLLFVQARLGIICTSFLFGALLVLISEYRITEQYIHLPTDSRVVEVRGEVLNYPDLDELRSRFELRVLSSNRTEVVAGHKILLSCYECPYSIQRGEIWKLTVKLKLPHGYASPGAYDYEKWLLRNAIHATGYVVESEGNALVLAKEPSTVTSVRGLLKQWIDSQIGGGNASGRAVVQALILGDRSGFDNPLWSTFRRTGVAHIFAISGLHIGLVWLFASSVVRTMSKAWPRMYFALPAPFIAGWCGVAAAIFYASLSGWGVPAQRAILMLILFQLNQSFGKQRCPFHGLLLIAVVMLLIDPLQVLDLSFWMSCYAVLVLIALTRSKSDDADNSQFSGWKGLLHLQLKLNLSMVPLVVMFFGEVSLIAPALNIILVPLLGSVLLPILILISCLFLLGAKGLASWALLYACFALEKLVVGLQFIAAKEFSAVQVSFSAGVIVIFIFGLSVLWSYRTKTGLTIAQSRLCKALALPSLVLGIYAFGVQQDKLAYGEFKVHVLDVGQGLSVVLQSANNTVVYDTGPRFRNGSTVVDSVVLPWLKYNGIKSLDLLVISHGDNDHIGGLNRILEALEVSSIHTSVRSLLKDNFVEDCNKIRAFSFDGIRGEYFDPGNAHISANNRSCVLKISGIGGSILLTGDIEKEVEGELVDAYGEQLRSEVLLVPHHGSNTSSRPIFLEAVRPAQAVISSGYLNSYRHPASEVVSRYQSRGVQLRDTASYGTVSFSFESDGIHTSEFRSSSPRLWRSVKQSTE